MAIIYPSGGGVVSGDLATRQSNTFNGDQTITGSLKVTSNISSSQGITASYFTGDGSQLSNLPILGGGVSAVDVSASFAELANPNTFTATNNFSTISASVISASQYVGITGGGGTLQTSYDDGNGTIVMTDTKPFIVDKPNSGQAGFALYSNDYSAITVYDGANLDIGSTMGDVTVDASSDLNLQGGNGINIGTQDSSGGPINIGTVNDRTVNIGKEYGSTSTTTVVVAGGDPTAMGGAAFLKLRADNGDVEIKNTTAGSAIPNIFVLSENNIELSASNLINLTGAVGITGSLLLNGSPVGGGGGVSSSEVSGAITGALGSYATLSSNSFNGNQTITGSLVTSGSLISLQANTRSQIKVVDERFDLIITGSRSGGTQILLDATNQTGPAQIYAQATNHAVMQAGSASANYPYYFHADAENKFVALEADDATATIYVGGSGYASAVNIGSSGSRIISVGNTGSVTGVVIKSGDSGTAVTGSLIVSGTIHSITGGIKFPDGSTLTSSVGLGVGGGGVSSLEVSGAITGALTPYATLSGVSASFTTPAQITGTLTNYATLGSNIFGGSQTITGSLTLVDQFLTPGALKVDVRQPSNISITNNNLTLETVNNGNLYVQSAEDLYLRATDILQIEATGASGLSITGSNVVVRSPITQISSSLIALSGAFVFPRITGAERATLSTLTGMTVYQTDTSGSDPEGLYIYKSTGWIQII